jgi:hypothetical protein
VSAWWLLLTLVGGVVVLAVLAILAVIRVARHRAFERLDRE